jgi:hypothetical protein
MFEITEVTAAAALNKRSSVTTSLSDCSCTVLM